MTVRAESLFVNNWDRNNRIRNYNIKNIIDPLRGTEM